MTPDLISRAAVGFYQFWHGRLRLPGAGWLLRRLAHCRPGLQRHPFRVPDVGTALLDFRDAGAYGMVNAVAGELENDRAVVAMFSELLKPGAVYWDVGANVGYLAQQLARPPFKLGAIELFEPNPTALLTLQSLFAGHRFATVHPVALGARNETLVLKVAPRGTPEGSLVREVAGGVPVSIPVRRGDDYRAEKSLPPPDFIKIDVEGFEPQVIEGLADTIRAHRPLILIEHIWLNDEEVRALLPHGYEIVFQLDDGTRTREFSRRRFGANALLVPSEKMPAGY
jgi:FkbM family methyltransferase